MKQLLLGNEALARGAWEAGVTVATAYPGTPSTEITENIAKYEDIYAEWSPNEKVAMEVAIGSSIGGARSLVCMKHVGLNVAADPLFTVSYTGVRGGLVIVVADDPGMHSSQNEQDSRYYALSAHIPMLEPSDSQECLDFVKLAFEISEQYDTPVFIRLTTRVAHSRSAVEVFGRVEVPCKSYEKNVNKYVMMPAMARARHPVVEARMATLGKAANGHHCNVLIPGSKCLGIISSGIAYQYAAEAVPNASFLKLGMVYPLPMDQIKAFASTVDQLVVIEELEPFIENALRAEGIACIGKECFSVLGEYTVRGIRTALGEANPEDKAPAPDLPSRPPVMCPGCPHRGVYYVLSKLKLTVCGDIGCYTLGALPPLASMDASVCMGASIGMALGMEKARGRDFAKKLVAVIGDSTFIHSGITGLVDVVYNGGNTTVLILDNSTTGMTGHQNHPATGKGIRGSDAPQLSLEAVCKAVGVENIQVTDPFQLEHMEKSIQHALEHEGPSVVIVRSPCALLSKNSKSASYEAQKDKCKYCKRCLKIGCPAIVDKGDRVEIQPTLCTGCGLCADLCAFQALQPQR